MGAESPTQTRWARRIARGVLLYVVVPYLAVTSLFVILQRRFLYPGARSGGEIRGKAALPGWIDDVALSTRNGLTLHGWFAAGEVSSAASGTPSEGGSRYLVIYFPGNSGNRRDRLGDLREFRRLGLNVLLFDYRGYGDNAGSPSEEAFAADARRVWHYARGELGVPAERILIFGESIGGAVAVRLAAECCRTGTPPAGLLLSSTFASLPETVARHYPYFPFQYFLVDRYRSVQRMPDVTCPVLVFHGTRDEFVPIEHARRLYAAAPAESRCGIAKRFVELPSGGHNAIPAAVLTESVAELVESIEKRQANGAAETAQERT